VCVCVIVFVGRGRACVCAGVGVGLGVGDSVHVGVCPVERGCRAGTGWKQSEVQAQPGVVWTLGLEQGRWG